MTRYRAKYAISPWREFDMLTHMEDYHGLAGAMINRAVRDTRCNDPAVRLEALNWLRQGDVGMLSFEMCCDLLGSNVDCVTKALYQPVKD